MTDEQLTPPSIDDVRRAAEAIAPHLSLPTPLLYSPALSERLDAHVSLKLEFANPAGVFKLRGGIFLASELTEEQIRLGLVTASTGNHAQSVAFAARLQGVPAVLFVPQGANPDKIAAIERLGGTVREGGERFDDARLAAAEYAAESGAFFVHSANEPRLIAGVGTAALEVLETQQPETELVIVPVGGGSGVAGWLTVRDGLGHASEVWGVQSAQAPAVHDSWKAHEAVERANTTLAEGLATAVGFDLPLEVMWRSLDDFLLVDDGEIEAAVIELLKTQHILAEPAGASPLAAALSAGERVRGRRVVLVVSGSNITLPQLTELLTRERDEG